MCFDRHFQALSNWQTPIHCEFSFGWQCNECNDIMMTISKKWPNLNTVVCPLYLGIILILFIKFERLWLISITLTNMISLNELNWILIILMVVYLCRIFTVLRTYKLCPVRPNDRRGKANHEALGKSFS